MKKNIVITGLDIGSSKIAAVAAQVGRDGTFSVIAHSVQPSGGVARGAVIDIKEAVRSVSGTLNKLKSKVSGSLGDIYVNISGETVRGMLSKGMTPICLRGREVTKADMEKCGEAASTVYLSFDREIIHKIVRKFSIDDEPPVQNPAGLYASRLSCEAYVITANVGHIQNVLKCVNNSGYDVREVVFTGLADGSSLLGRNNPESADILVDMGSSLTEICGYADGSLTGFDIVPAGGEDYKSGFTNNGQFDYIIVKTKSMLEDLSKSTRAINPVILAGGASLSDGMVEYLEERLSHPVKMGIVKDVRGNISSMDSIRLSTAIGLAKYAQGKYLERARSRANLPSNLVAKVIDIFNNYF